MDRLITFESRAEEKLEYYSCEFLYGLFEAVETGWDYAVSGIAWLGAHNGAPMILAFYGEDAYQKHLDYWDKKAEEILTDNWSRRQRNQNARNHSASAFERKVGEMVGAFGGMLPISLVSAINPVAGAAMSGLNTAGKTSRDAIESGNGIGDALAYGLVAGSVDFALNALSSTAFQARGQGGWGEKLVSRVAKTRGGDLALRTIAGTLVDTGADTLSLLMQHNIKKMYDPNYKETLSEEEVLKTIAVSLVVNGGMRLGTNMSKGVYETDADGMLKPLDEARMMGQMPKGADEPKIMDMEGDESGGFSGMFRDMEAENPGVDTKGLEIEAEPSSVKVEGDDIINNKALSAAERLKENSQRGHAFEAERFGGLKKRGFNAQREITIAPFDQNGNLGKKRIRADAIGINERGELLIQEYKSSLTAPFTKNQKEGFPNLINYGGVVKGKGKGIFQEGFPIDPEKLTLEVVRPNGIVDWRDL